MLSSLVLLTWVVLTGAVSDARPTVIDLVEIHQLLGRPLEPDELTFVSQMPGVELQEDTPDAQGGASTMFWERYCRKQAAQETGAENAEDHEPSYLLDPENHGKYCKADQADSNRYQEWQAGDLIWLCQSHGTLNGGDVVTADDVVWRERERGVILRCVVCGNQEPNARRRARNAIPTNRQLPQEIQRRIEVDAGLRHTTFEDRQDMRRNAGRPLDDDGQPTLHPMEAVQEFIGGLFEEIQRRQPQQNPADPDAALTVVERINAQR